MTALVLLWRRHRLEGLALLGGFALTYAGVHVTKAAVERPRPADALVARERLRVPVRPCGVRDLLGSGRGGAAARVPAAGGAGRTARRGDPIAVVVGLTRIYLRAHWFSDVAGGWGLGSMCFALAGIVALVAGYLRSGEAEPVSAR